MCCMQTPTGLNVNRDCGSTHMEQPAADYAQDASDCDVGVCLSTGTPNRCSGAGSKTGNLVDGDRADGHFCAGRSEAARAAERERAW